VHACYLVNGMLTVSIVLCAAFARKMYDKGL
jgi:hypothetical protein